MRIKFIATATLLAASTALAPAATILFSLKGFQHAYGDADHTNLGFALFSGTKSSIDDCVTMSSGSASSTFSSTNFLQKITGKNMGGTDVADGITFSVTSGAISSVRQTGTDPQYTAPTVAGKTYTNDDCIAYFSSTGLSSSSETYSAGTYTVAFGDLYWYGRKTDHSIDNTSHLGAVQYFTFTIDRDVGANEAVEVTFTDESSAKASLASETKASAPLAVSAKIIPEPSAFGLLAGLGAIALAVSRRRRSR